MDANIANSQLPDQPSLVHHKYVPPPTIVIDHYAKLIWDERNEAQPRTTRQTMDDMREFAGFITIISRMYVSQLNSGITRPVKDVLM